MTATITGQSGQPIRFLTKPNVSGDDVLVSSDFATEAEAQALEILTKLISPARLGDAMNAHVLGMGQTWQDMKSQRAVNTTYTNTTGRPIIVSVTSEDNSTNNSGVYFYVNGQEVARQVGRAEVSIRPATNLSILVPAGATYRVNIQEADTLLFWRELR